jgi:hypothetical protein
MWLEAEATHIDQFTASWEHLSIEVAALISNITLAALLFELKIVHLDIHLGLHLESHTGGHYEINAGQHLQLTANTTTVNGVTTHVGSSWTSAHDTVNWN